MSSPLSKTGARRLATAEAAIERGLSTFWEVGSALMQIRDERLYRDDFDTFENYCQHRWGITRRRANQLVEAAQMGTMVPIENERQARALAPVKEDPAEVREMYAEAERRGDTTSAGLARVVAERKNVSTATNDSLLPTGNTESSGEEDMPLSTGSGVGEGVAPGRTREAPSSSSPVPPVDPTLGYRARATAERSKVRDALLTLDAERVVDTTDDPKAWADFSSDLRGWLDELDQALAGPRLKAVQ